MAVDRRAQGRERFSQLTLFPQPKPIDEHRWPRGFTPERMAEVKAARIGMEFHEPPTQVGTGRATPSVLDATWYAPMMPLDDGGAFGEANPQQLNRQLGARRIRETIARSGTPMTDLQGSGETGPSREVFIHVDPHRSTERRRGSYEGSEVHGLQFIEINEKVPSALDLDPYAPSGTVTDSSRRVKAERSLMHELGHHRSFAVDRTAPEHSEMLRQISEGDDAEARAAARAMGAEEGRADRNVDERYVPHRKDRATAEVYDQGNRPASGYEVGTRGFRTYVPNNAPARRAAYAGYREERGLPKASEWRPQSDIEQDDRMDRWVANGSPVQEPLFRENKPMDGHYPASGRYVTMDSEGWPKKLGGIQT